MKTFCEDYSIIKWGGEFSIFEKVGIAIVKHNENFPSPAPLFNEIALTVSDDIKVYLKITVKKYLQKLTSQKTDTVQILPS